MDIRHPLTDFDQMLLAWANNSKMPIHILLTKADKLTYGAAKNTLLTVQRQLTCYENIPVSIQLFSAIKRLGTEEVLLKLRQWLHIET